MTSNPCTPQTRTAADGAELTACAHGGHVLGWTPAGGRPRLWLSLATGCGPGVAIRGGVPVIFPQFAARGPLPKHGVARDRAWQVRPESGDDVADGAARFTAVLADDAGTRAVWPEQFGLTLSARALGDRLDITLTVHNPGERAWPFTAALHSYLALGDPGATVHGLGGLPGEDNADDRRPITLGAPGEAQLATAARDVALPGATGRIVVDDPVLGRLELDADGFDDRVMWNPGAGAGLSDVRAGAEQEFVCIEPAALTPVLLAPGRSWTGRQTLRSVATTDH